VAFNSAELAVTYEVARVENGLDGGNIARRRFGSGEQQDGDDVSGTRDIVAPGIARADRRSKKGENHDRKQPSLPRFIGQRAFHQTTEQDGSVVTVVTGRNLLLECSDRGTENSPSE
jgi:hypothetical protein